MNKISKILLFVALFALATTVSANIPDEEGVLVLSDSNFQEAIEKHEFVLVEFYAPWCGHCKKLAPEYVKAAADLKAENSKAVLAKVDSTIHKHVSEKYGVKGYPTLKFFVKGQALDYEGGRTQSEIVNYLRKKTLPSNNEVATTEELAAAISRNEVLVVFFGGKDDAGYGVFDGASKGHDDVGFVYTTNAQLRTEQNVPEGTHVLLLKKFDEGRNELAGSLDARTLKDFIDGHKTPTLLPFDQKAAQKIFGDNIPTLFLIYEKNEAGTKAEEIFKEVAHKLKGKIQASISNIKDGGLGPRLAEYVGVKDSETPAIRIVVPSKGGNPKKFVYDQELTVENLIHFHGEYHGGRLSSYYKSEPVPEQTQPVKILVGKNFEEIVFDETKDVLVEFYAPWCGHCKKLTPIWDELAAQLAPVQNLVIAKMDSTANEHESVSVSGFPTIKFYPAGSKKKVAIPYDSDRTKEGFLKWLKAKVTVEHDPSVFEASKGDEL